MRSKEIGVSVYGVVPVTLVDGNVSLCVVLGEAETERALPIFIDPFTATAIEAAFELMQTARPLTHKTCVNLVVLAKAKIEKVVVNDIRDNTYFAEIFLRTPDGAVAIVDSRPSDAIIFALEANAPIFIEEKVFKSFEEIASKESQDAFKEIIKTLRGGH